MSGEEKRTEQNSRSREDEEWGYAPSSWLASSPGYDGVSSLLRVLASLIFGVWMVFGETKLNCPRL